MTCWRREEEKSQSKRHGGENNSFIFADRCGNVVGKVLGILRVHPISPTMMWLCQAATFCYFIYFKNSIWYVEKNIISIIPRHWQCCSFLCVPFLSHSIPKPPPQRQTCSSVQLYNFLLLLKKSLKYVYIPK